MTRRRVRWINCPKCGQAIKLEIEVENIVESIQVFAEVEESEQD